MFVAYVVTKHGNFIVSPGDVSNYKTVLYGDQRRDTSAFAAKRGETNDSTSKYRE